MVVLISQHDIYIITGDQCFHFCGRKTEQYQAKYNCHENTKSASVSQLTVIELHTKSLAELVHTLDYIPAISVAL